MNVQQTPAMETACVLLSRAWRHVTAMNTGGILIVVVRNLLTWFHFSNHFHVKDGKVYPV